MTVTEQFSVESARQAADEGRLERWVCEFLASDGSDNAALAEELEGRGLSWDGPRKIEFDRLHRLAGPPDQPTVERLDEDDEERVESMCESIRDGWEPAPMVVTRKDELDQYVVEDGNHRIEALRRAGHDDWWCVVGE